MAAAAGGGGSGAGAASGAISFSGPESGLVGAVHSYLDKIIRPRERPIEGMKVLLLDKETKGIVSMVYGMSEILEKDIFLVSSLDKKRADVKHMKALVFIRANVENLHLLKEELAAPKCSEYHLCACPLSPRPVRSHPARGNHRPAFTRGSPHPLAPRGVRGRARGASRNRACPRARVRLARRRASPPPRAVRASFPSLEAC